MRNKKTPAQVADSVGVFLQTKGWLKGGLVGFIFGATYADFGFDKFGNFG